MHDVKIQGAVLARGERSRSIENAIGAKVLIVPNERRDEETREE